MLNLFCFARKSGGKYLQLRGRVLRTVTPAGVGERLLESADDLVTTLRDEFTLDIPEATTLWPKVCARHEDLFTAQNDAIAVQH